MKPEFNNLDLSRFKSLLDQKHTIVVTTHYKPDGDAMGSSLAWATYLRKLGHQVHVVIPSEFPGFLTWMEGSESVIDFIAKPEEARSLISSASLICCLDFNDPKRTEGMSKDLMESSAIKMVLDHHLNPQHFCEFTFSFPKVGSTAELVFHLIRALDSSYELSRDQAECIYAGIMTDTGSFRFNSVTSETHRVISTLLDAGARNNYVHEMIYDSYSENRLRFLGHCLLNCMVVLQDFKTVIFKISKTDMSTFDHAIGDLEGVVNYGLSIQGIVMAALFSERDGIVKISFRSKGDFSVMELAQKHFEGGGHKNAAGGRSFQSLNDTVSRFEKLLPHYIQELNK
jgi:phosphoesterase RecJ-like protein